MICMYCGADTLKPKRIQHYEMQTELICETCQKSQMVFKIPDKLIAKDKTESKQTWFSLNLLILLFKLR